MTLLIWRMHVKVIVTIERTLLLKDQKFQAYMDIIIFALYRHMMTSPNVWKIVKRADVKLRIYAFQVRFHCPIQFGSIWDLLVVIYSSW